MAAVSRRMQRYLLRCATARHALFALAGGLVVTTLVFQVISNFEYKRAVAAFESLSQRRIASVKDALQDAMADLASVNQFFITFTPASAEEFDRIALPLLARNPHIQNFAFHRMLPDEERAAFETKMQARIPGAAISEIEEGRHVPAKRRAQYRVIEYVAPQELYKAALGLDVSTRAEQRDAALRACRTGQVSATRPYRLIHQQMGGFGFVMLAPVYRVGAQATAGTNRCDALTGYTAAVFDSERLVRESLAAFGRHGVDDAAISVHVADGTVQGIPVFRDGDHEPRQECAGWLCAAGFFRGPLEWEESFEVAGARWHVLVSRASSFPKSARPSAMAALGAGVIASLLAAAYMQLRTQKRRRIRRLSRQRAIELRHVRELASANRDLGKENARLVSLFEQAPGFIAVLRTEHHVFELANEAYFRLVGRRDILGRSVREALPEIEGQGFFELLDKVFSRAEPYVGRALPISVMDPQSGGMSTHYVDFVYQPIIGDDGKVAGIFVQGNDRTGEKTAQSQLEYLSTHDPLTKLPNQAHLYARLEHAISGAGDGGQKLAVAVIDLDGFKRINDSLGRKTGDNLIRASAQRLQSVGGAGVVARLSGDKFALIPEPGISAQFDERFPRRIIEGFAAPFDGDGTQVFLSCSVGLAVFPDDATTAESLVQCADIAMYSAKERGRNTFRFFTPKMNDNVRARLKLEIDLRAALERDEFVLHYQPQVDLVTGQVVGVEALLRWNHPERGLIGPASFIDVAEQSGLILPIGDWVLQTACAQVKTWQEEGLGDVRVAVNLSARQFSEQNIATRIAELLGASGIAPTLLDIELTESLVMQDVERVVEILSQMRELGVQLSVDDFGTGYSSLSYLKQFPIDVLKIDRSFVAEIPDNANAAAIADAIISMAHSLGIRVIAEGVEKEAQCEFLSRHMCNEIQGFLFSPALPAGDVSRLLRERRSLPEPLLRLHRPPRTMLLVDDEPSILSALKRQFRGCGYQILTASSGPEGLEVLASHAVDVIVSDQRMPGMTGVEFLRTVKKLYPDTVRIVLSGFTELQSVTDAVNEGAIYKFLTKPWEDDRLREHIEEAFQHKEMANENRRLSLEVRAANQELARANKQLEDVLKRRERQIRWNEVSLKIAHEALQHVPIPVIALDDDEIVVFLNASAEDLFGGAGSLLGAEAASALPVLMLAVDGVPDGEARAVQIDGDWFSALVRRMGKGTDSRGMLITLLAPEAHD